jgi:hypothetical protein
VTYIQGQSSIHLVDISGNNFGGDLHMSQGSHFTGDLFFGWKEK